MFTFGSFDATAVEGLSAVLSAWPGMPEVQLHTVASPGRDGVFYADSGLSSGEWVFDLIAVAPTPEAVLAITSQVTRALSPRAGQQALRVDIAPGWTWSAVTSSLTPWTRAGWIPGSECRLRATLTFTTPDPYGYATPDESWSWSQGVEVRRNYARNPRQISTGSNWERGTRWSWGITYETGDLLGFGTFSRTTPGGSGTVGGGRGVDLYGNADVAPGIAAVNRACPVVAGVPVQLSAAMRVSAAALVQFQLRVHDGNGNWLGPITPDLSIPTMGAGESRRIDSTFTPTESGYAAFRLMINSVGWVSSDYMDFTGVYAGFPGEWFDGDYSPEPNLTPAWVGAPNASESVLRTRGASDLADGVAINRSKGNTDSSPEIAVKGTLTAAQQVTLTLNGQPVTVQGPLTAADELRLDYAAMDFGLWRAGVKQASVVSRMSSFDRLMLPVGESVFAASSSGTLSEVTVKANSRQV